MSDGNEDLRYPVGKHVRPTTIGEAERKAAISTLAEMPERMRAALSGLDEAKLDTPYRLGGWSVRQLVHHVADSHGMALGRVKKALTEEWPVIFAYDEGAFAKLPDSLSAPVPWSLDLIDGAHKRWVLLLESLTDEQWKRGFAHPERGRQTIEGDVVVRVARSAPCGSCDGAAEARRLVAVLKTCVVVLTGCMAAGAQQSRWVHPGPEGKLVYAHSPQGDRIVDFSYAGYRGGGVAIPNWPATQTVGPSGADDTATIQAAVDAVSKLPLDANGHRGSVWLTAGTFHCEGTLKITASGVVLRGAGPVAANGGTTIELTGKPHLGIDVAGEFHLRVLDGGTTIPDAYVPSGANVIHVADASAIRAGDTLQIVKPVTAAWVKFMGMDQLSRSDREEKWVAEDLKVYRRVAKVEGNAVTLEVPLTDDIDAKFLEGRPAPVSRVEITGRIVEVGVEGLSVVAPARSVAYQEDAEFDGLRLGNAVDSWIRAVHFADTTNSVAITSGTERITVREVNVEQQHAVTSSAKNFAFSVNGSQVLFDRISGKGDSVFFFATQARQQGPVVVLNCKFLGDGRIEPHQRWSTGLLVDECEVPGGGISLQNRGTMGSGHGWTIGWSVLWNNKASTILVQNPPGVANWSIGDRGGQISAPMPTSGKPKGADLPRGLVESSGKPVTPTSLYLEQLRERLGDAAVKAIGY